MFELFTAGRDSELRRPAGGANDMPAEKRTGDGLRSGSPPFPAVTEVTKVGLVQVRRFLAVVVLAASVAGLTACATAGETELPAPIIVTPDEAAGTTVEVPSDNTLVIDVDGDVTAWTGESADAHVVEFVPGRDDGDATFNPGFEPHGEGTTEVSITDGATGETYDFTVTVTP